MCVEKITAAKRYFLLANHKAYFRVGFLIG